MRSIISILLITTYLVVLGHGLIPHHHHERSVSDTCSQEQTHEISSVQTEICSSADCHHHDEAAIPCHFEIDPVPGKILLLQTAFLLQQLVQEFRVPEKENVVWLEHRIAIPRSPLHQAHARRGPPSIA
ncbi:hypothetical protein [Mangrovibacterium sp.]|uniref:hypothetical protein n=1 Tax=Mangrovibacterium sp. TaxID=1961364 RepID=UPI003565CD8E